jgi:sigma-B regulation protein RsbU (phosphoserine phosphatase)
VTDSGFPASNAPGASSRGADAPGANDWAGAFALLAEMTRDLAASLDLEATLRHALASIVRHVGAEAGSLWMLEPGGRELLCVASVGAHPITGARLASSEGILGRCVRENAGQRVLDVRRDPHFARRIDEQSGFVTRSILCAPMAFSDRVLGAIELINKRTGDGCFVAADAQLLEVLAASAALAVANAELARAQVEHERVRRELELAAEIQQGLLPAPRPAPFPVQAMNLPARTVSGDFFDFLELGDGRIAFCLGDVSGKGMNAALLGARTASLYRCLARETSGPGALLARLDAELAETVTRGMFVTLAAGVCEPRRGRLRLANAGHEPPLLRAAAGGFTAFPAEAPPLGVLGDAKFPELELDLGGGVLYVFSDGLTEACGLDGRPLGPEGVERLLERFAGLGLRERVDAVAAELGTLGLRDDATLLGVCDARGARP